MAIRSPLYTEDDDALREQIVHFCEREIEPHGEAWEEAGTFPRALYNKAGDAGLLGLGFPEDYGGAGGDVLHYCMVREEISRTGYAGVRVGLMAHGIGLPPVIKHGSEQIKREVGPQVLCGDKIICLAISEPNAGSDVANIITRAQRDGDDYIVNGEKAFISNGVRADYYTTAVRTGGDGRHGISVLLIPRDTPWPDPDTNAQSRLVDVRHRRRSFRQLPGSGSKHCRYRERRLHGDYGELQSRTSRYRGVRAGADAVCL